MVFGVNKGTPVFGTSQVGLSLRSRGLGSARSFASLLAPCGEAYNLCNPWLPQLRL